MKTEGTYFVAAVLFIFGLKQMSSPKTARSGIIWAGVGMAVATLVTFLVPGLHNFGWMILAIVSSSAIAWYSGKKVAMTDMPQMIALYNGMGGGAAAAIAAVELVKLAGCEDLMPSQLSGGMAKRAAFARALIMDPKLLIFDEPSAGLDPVTSADLDTLILELREATRATIVVVTHELESALHIADRITVLAEGQVLMTGTVEEVRDSDHLAIQDLLNRRSRSVEFDADDYLHRLTERRGDRR